MTAQHVAWLLLGVASGVGSGYPWGRVQLRRAKFREFAPRLREALRRAYDRGYDWGREDGYADALDDLDAWPKDGEAVMPNDPGRNAQGRPGPLVAPGAPLSLADGAPGLDWRERTAIELAPETLANDVPRARTGGRPVTPEQPGPGHPWEPRRADCPHGICTSRCPDDDCACDCAIHRHSDDLADELAAEAEAHLARHAETHDEWIARMDYEHALWCAEAGLVNEWAAA